MAAVPQSLAADDVATEQNEESSTTDEKEANDAEAKEEKKQDEQDDKVWKPLFDGKTLKGWKKTDFAGPGEVKVEDGQLILQYGAIMTGVTWDEKLFKFPNTNYEIRLKAQRVDGSDFFCGLTFPIGKEHCSLIVGGWGGALVGISSIDGYDASENETSTFDRFEKKKWYNIRVRVTDDNLKCWLDDKNVVDIDRPNREFSVRWEVEESRPLGIASYQTTAAIKDFEFRKLGEEELKKLAEEEKEAESEDGSE